MINTKSLRLKVSIVPEAVAYLTEQVSELKKLVTALSPAPTDTRQLVGIDDACRIIQKAKPTVYALVRKGLFPSYKKGKQLYFDENELLEWIETGRKATSSQCYDQMLSSMQRGIRHKPKTLRKP